MPPAMIRRLETEDVEDFRSIRLSALECAPEAFGSLHEEEKARPVADFRKRLATATVFGAYRDGRIVGMAGFRQEEGRKNSHKGSVWGVYVKSDARGKGIASALIEAVIAAAAGVVEQLTLTLVDGNKEALALYRRFGFTVYGIEPRSLKSAEGYRDEVLMALMLKSD